MGGINSTIEERHAKKLKRYLSKHKDTNSYQKTCISYNPRKATDYMRRLDQPLWFLTAIHKIVDAQKEEGLKLLLKATRKSCICIRSIPTIRAIQTWNLESLQLLLDNGGESNPIIYIPEGWSFRGPYRMFFVLTWLSKFKYHGHLPSNGPEILKCLVNAGSNVDVIMFNLIRMESFFDSDLLDVLFPNGLRTFCLGYSIEGHANYIIWLVRHGAFTRVVYKDGHFTKSYITLAIVKKRYSAIELILHAGLDISIIAPNRSSFGRCEIVWQHDGQEEDILRVFRRGKAFEASHHYRQASDLQEFSDESLNIYPEPHLMTNAQCLQRMTDFLSQPAPLKWLCRRKLRQNMISHCASAINSLPLPKPLKRYIMCHTV